VGNYNSLDRGYAQNAALMFSGGIADFYCLGLIREVLLEEESLYNFSENLKSTHAKNKMKSSLFVPSVNELIEIISLALEMKNIVTCAFIDVRL
jgi:hypothetical protein